jgi:hypothetical protein
MSNQFTNALVDELDRIWVDVKDVDPEEIELAKQVALDAAKLGAAALLGEVDETELEVLKATKDQLSAIAAIRVRRTAQLAVSRVIDRVLTAGIGLLAS